jgi:hypothetical protein
MPLTHISFDDYLKGETRWAPDTYKMPSKPIEEGFKFYWLADNGYMWDFHSVGTGLAQ